jgi:hypothetical protein
MDRDLTRDAKPPQLGVAAAAKEVLKQILTPEEA